jgi:hypothetical protein
VNRFLAYLACLTLAGLFYVYEEVEAVKIGYCIRRQEAVKTEALDRARVLKYNIASLKAPNNLEKRLLAERIKLEPPKSWQTIEIGNSGKAKGASWAAPFAPRPSFFGKLFLGTAQAEAKETSSR